MTTQTSLRSTIFSGTDADTAQRIIVLLPDAEIDLAYAAKRISDIASAANCKVQFIGLCADAFREPGLRRQMVTLSALVENERIAVRSRVEVGKDWLNAVQTEWRQGDIIVCFAGVSAGFSRKPLSQILQSTVQATIYVIDRLPGQAQLSRFVWWSDVSAWVGSLAIILGMFWLQTSIAGLPSYWARTLLFCVSIFVEFGSIWMWNSLFS